MALKNYGVFRGKIIDYHPQREDDKTPHFQLFIKMKKEIALATINVKSRIYPSSLALHIDYNFQNKAIENLPKLEEKFTKLSSYRRQGLDYLRSNLFDLQKTVALPPDVPGKKNDLQDLVSSLCYWAKKTNADIYIFGEPFEKGNGIHNIHMNQGNYDRYAIDNGIFQDGGILINFHNLQRWVALFLAFQTQAIKTNRLGEPLDRSPQLIDIISSNSNNRSSTIFNIPWEIIT